jgi:hypothetical protein
MKFRVRLVVCTEEGQAETQYEGIVNLTCCDANQPQVGERGDAHRRHPRRRAPSLSAMSGSARPSVADRLLPPTGAGRDGSETQ